MRILLFTGKGGVGKSTLAAAHAVARSAAGQRVLLVSTDQAHSVADALGVAVGGSPTAVAPGLFATHLDTAALVQGHWERIRAAATSALGQIAEPGSAAEHLAAVEPEELMGFPGVEELAALSEVVRLAQAQQWDLVVVDCAPTAETLRMLALPELVGDYVERLWPRHARILGWPVVRRPAQLRALAVELCEKIDSSAAALRELLRDKNALAVRLVCTPERVVLEETRRLVSALAMHQVSVDSLLINRVIPGAMGASSSAGAGPEDSPSPSPSVRWLAGQQQRQNAVIADLALEFGRAMPLWTVPYAESEPVGIGSLAGLADAVTRLAAAEPVLASSPSPGAPAMTRVSGSGLDAVYSWHLPLGIAESAEVDLGRIDDDLMVHIGSVRRRYKLPSALRRCIAVDAEVTDESLVVFFRPDPQVWMSNADAAP